MKRLIVSILCCLSAYAMAQRPQPTANDSLISTEVLPGNKVAFRIYAPKADSVNLRSDDKWDKIDFKKDSRGVWEGIWTDVQPGAYRYRFVVDGVNVYDPKSPTARENPALFMETSGNEFFAMKDDVPHGAISQRHYYSETLKQTRRLHVWTPAGFEKSKKKLPVFYLIHGGGDTDISWSRIGCVGNILDNLLAEGKIEPMIVVMPNGRIETGSDTYLGRVPIFTDDLMTGIFPIIESNYHVYPDGAHRAIMGLSFGGLKTLETVTYHYDDFDYIGVLSSGWWISDTWAEKRGMTDIKNSGLSI
jgi:enterochelin esterase-like enzyme